MRHCPVEASRASKLSLALRPQLAQKAVDWKDVDVIKVSTKGIEGKGRERRQGSSRARAKQAGNAEKPPHLQRPEAQQTVVRREHNRPDGLLRKEEAGAPAVPPASSYAATPPPHAPPLPPAPRKEPSPLQRQHQSRSPLCRATALARWEGQGRRQRRRPACVRQVAAEAAAGPAQLT